MAVPATQLQEPPKSSIASTWSNSSPSSRNSSTFESPSPVSEHTPQLTLDAITSADNGQPTPLNSPSVPKSQELSHMKTSESSDDPLVQQQDSFILHQISMLLTDDTLNGFIRRTRHFSNILKLSLSSYFTEEGIRIATWWFLQGRMVLEPLLQEQSNYEDAQHNESLLAQVHLNLCKALWVLHETWTNAEREARINFRNFQCKTQRHLPQLLSLRLELLLNIRQSISAMQRKGILPKPKDSILSGVLESAILVPYPSLNLDMEYLMTGYHTSVKSEVPLSNIFPLGDTTKEFHYGSMNVNIFLMAGGDDTQQTRLQFPAILSMIRRRNEDELSVVIGTQNGIVDFSISSSRRHQPRWENVEWITPEKALLVKLRTGFSLRLCFNPWDYVTLKKNYQHYNKTQASFLPSQDETLLLELELSSAQYRTKEASDRFFPANAIKSCRVRLFERQVKRVHSGGSRKVHRGLRLVVITPTSVKTAGIISQEYQPGKIVLFGFHNENSIERLSLRIEDSCPDATLDLDFQQVQAQNTFLAHLTGCYVHNQEQLLLQVPISRFLFSSGLEPSLAQPFSDMRWNSLRVFGQHPSESQTSQLSMPILSESLRIIVDSPKGRITDRINIGIGQLKIRRNVISSGHELHVLRESQDDLMMSYNDLEARGNLLDNLSSGLECIQSRQTARTYSFPKLSDLHIFQMAITGFSVLFDCMVSSFSISRRRRMIPYRKEWTPPHTRVQILKRGSFVQLVAYFEGFKHGKCMSFALKETDVYHTLAKGCLLKLVDAKFSLPVAVQEGMREEELGFACLDVMEYPGEHDNIVISFNSDLGKSLTSNSSCRMLTCPRIFDLLQSVTCTREIKIKSLGDSKSAKGMECRNFIGGKSVPNALLLFT